MLGSRQQLKQMIEAIERNDIHLVINEKVFSLEKLISTRAPDIQVARESDANEYCRGTGSISRR